MTTRHIARMAAAVLLAVSTAQAGVIFVDAGNCPGPGGGTLVDPYCSIQTAIDNVVDTDEIVVAPGTYFETIDFLGKAITLRSSDGAEVTVIDGTGFFHVVQCVSSEGPDTILDGCTITGVGVGVGTGAEANVRFRPVLIGRLSTLNTGFSSAMTWSSRMNSMVSPRPAGEGPTTRPT